MSSLYEYNSVSTSELIGTNNVEIERETKIKARLGIPMILKDNVLFGLQLKYDNHSFINDFNDNIPLEFYQQIRATRFRSLGGRFCLNFDIDERREFSAILGGEVRADEIIINSNTTKFYLSANYKIQKNENVKLGGGLALGYTLGNPQIYPLFFYENQLSRKWTLDLALPKRAALRLRSSDKSFITFKTELKGWRYAITNSTIFDETVIFRRADVRFGANFEHEIHDWLWFGVDAGYSKNIRHFISRPGDSRRDAVATLNTSDSPYLNLSIFIVPPKKIYR